MHIFEHKVLHVLIAIYNISMCYLQILLADWGFFFLFVFFQILEKHKHYLWSLFYHHWKHLDTAMSLHGKLQWGVYQTNYSWALFFPPKHSQTVDILSRTGIKITGFQSQLGLSTWTFQAEAQQISLHLCQILQNYEELPQKC